MNTKLFKILLSILFIFLWTSCEDPEDTNTGSETAQDCPECGSTIGGSVNGTNSDPIASLFFDLTNESLEYTYDFYSISGIGYANTIDLPCSIRETDLVSFYTFPDYLIEAENCEWQDCGWCTNGILESINFNPYCMEILNPGFCSNSNFLNEESCLGAGHQWEQNDMDQSECESLGGIWDNLSYPYTNENCVRTLPLPQSQCSSEYINEYDLDGGGWCIDQYGYQIDCTVATWVTTDEQAEAECEFQLEGTWFTPAEGVNSSDIYNDPLPLDETYGGQCSCQCLDSDGYAVDCNSNNAVARAYSEPAAPAGGACQNSFYVNQSDCETYGWIWFTGTIDCSLMDANQDCVMEDEIDEDIVNIEEAEFSISYTNLEKLFWDKEAGRYKPQVSSEIVEEVTLTDDSDVYDIERYWSIINGWDAINIDGMVYVDHSQWNDTTVVVEEQPITCTDVDDEADCISDAGCIWENEFCTKIQCEAVETEEACQLAGNCLWINNECDDGQYPVSVDIVIDQIFEYTASILNSDSLMFHINSDCDNNGEWTESEDYEDVGIDGCTDEYEDSQGGCLPTPDATEPDPNGDNYNCGLDGICPCDPGYPGPDTNEGGSGTECNGQYDCISPNCNIEISGDNYEGEPFTDRPDNLPAAEIFWDIPILDTEEGNGIWMGEEKEPWADLNCNNWYDDASDGSGNGIWDDDEIYQDLNNNQTWDEGEPLYKISDTPNQIIVNYDTNGDGVVNESDGPPEAISEIDPDEINSVMSYLNGSYAAFDDIIKEESYSEYKYYTYTPIASVKTFFSNQIIEDIPPPLIDNDQYNIAKTYWPTLPNGTDVDGDGISDRFYDYDYHLYKYDEGSNNNLLKLMHPAYYYDPGFFESPDAIEDGFFEISDLIEDIMVYVNGSNLREGEVVITFSTDSVDVTGDGTHNHIYDITKEFTVEYEEVDVPLRTDEELGEIFSNISEGDTVYVNNEMFINNCDEGDMIVCYSTLEASCSDDNDNAQENECGELIKEINQCSPYKTLNAYKIVRTKTSVMHGSGVEYGERNTIWLSEGLGIVKDKLEIRWTGENGNMDNWTEFSRLELRSTEQSESGFNLGRLFNSGEVININNFGNEGNFNNDPYIPQPTAILQRVRINND